jgi:hypothetical protein
MQGSNKGLFIDKKSLHVFFRQSVILKNYCSSEMVRREVRDKIQPIVLIRNLHPGDVRLTNIWISPLESKGYKTWM